MRVRKTGAAREQDGRPPADYPEGASPRRRRADFVAIEAS